MKTKIILFCLFASLSLISKAQYITIPDPHFANWLNVNLPSAMMGNQMDTSSLDVKNLSAINIWNDSILDLTGIQYFTSLKNLDCSDNLLTNISALPDSLETFNCSGNQLDSLPALPLFVKFLYCSDNHLSTLPVLPDSLAGMNCDINSLTSLPVLPSKLFTLNCAGNLINTLPVLPDSLTELNCSGNNITILPTLHDYLLNLNCSYNQLTSLPVLPLTLTTLDCGGNMLATLPALPGSLMELDCYYNQITGLPALPSSLTTLVCGGNLITMLPALPSTLLLLKCYFNQLSALPVLPSSLNYLSCSNNPIPVLPALNPGLQTLYCDFDLLTNLPVLPSSLQVLTCSGNSLTDLPVLNPGLLNLTCDSDGLDSIPALPYSLNLFSCKNNVLTMLPVLPPALSTLECDNNQLTALPSLPGTLAYLSFSNNQVTSIPGFPVNLNWLFCSDNQINCFPVFPSTIDSIHIQNNLITCLPNYIPAMDPLTLSYPLCIDSDFVNNPNGCAGAQGIVGFAYLDNNSNCLKDSVDFNYTNIPMKLYGSAGAFIGATYTASNGVYNFSEPDGVYTVSVDTTSLPFIPQCIAPGFDSTVLITASAPLVSNVNFNFACKPGFDIGVKSVLPIGLVFPGEQHKLQIIAGDMSQWYNMHCAAGISGQVKITVNGPVTCNGITSGALTPAISGHDYIYSITDFALVNIRTAFGLLFTTDTSAAEGAHICIHIEVTPTGGDNDSLNNVYNFCYNVVNSHDPNLKEVYPGNVSPKYMDWLTYTIHFQNTGNAPAMNIHIEDTLDTDLDLATFEVINYSHQNTATLNGNILTFRFAHIILPDSASDPAGSQGYVQYRIKIKHYLPFGTQVNNTAYIYFDYNDPVVTNTTTNELTYEGTLSVNETEKQTEVSVFPNPGKGVFNVRFNGDVNQKEVNMEVYNVLGERVWKSSGSTQTNKIDLSDQTNGIYILKITGDDLHVNQRIIKQ